jgi:hypothetical protein
LGSKKRLGLKVTKRQWILFAAFLSYFALFLIPKGYPAFAAGLFSFLLILSILAVLAALLGLAVWSTIALLISWRRKRPLGRLSRWVADTTLGGFVAFVICFVLFQILPSALPSGSNLSNFDQSVWLDPRSIDDMENNTTARQRMLGAVVAELPGRTRAEIEKTLGPSLDTEYFKSNGRDLIYILGPERDSPFRIDSEWLLIWLDETGTFERYQIATD